MTKEELNDYLREGNGTIEMNKSEYRDAIRELCIITDTLILENNHLKERLVYDELRSALANIRVEFLDEGSTRKAARIGEAMDFIQKNR